MRSRGAYLLGGAETRFDAVPGLEQGSPRAVSQRQGLDAGDIASLAGISARTHQARGQQARRSLPIAHQGVAVRESVQALSLSLQLAECSDIDVAGMKERGGDRKS